MGTCPLFVISFFELKPMSKTNFLLLACPLFFFLSNCTQKPKADLILMHGKVYTMQWDDPDLDGKISSNAPYVDGNWHPEAEAIAIKDNLILAIGSDNEMQKYAGNDTQIIDVHGGTILPGLVDSHTHVINLGQNLDLVDLTVASNEAEAVALIVEQAKNIPAGEWIVGKGWDEGAWASHYPDKKLLTERVPNHPVLMRSLHSFASWCNQKALDVAGFTKDIKSPIGGVIMKDDHGQLTGLFLNKATDMIEKAIPAPDHGKLKSWFLAGLNEMAKSGYVSIHEAGVGAELMQAIDELDKENKLPIRVYVMLSSDDKPLMDEWKIRGPYVSNSGMLVVKAVKAFYDGALGSRGAKLIENYSDMPGHQGISGTDFRFDPATLNEMAKAGFQLCVHAIGDAANRETLNYFEKMIQGNPLIKEQRHRIEHAQVVSDIDMSRFASLGVIASMQPSHAVEDMMWAETRLGSERIKNAYAWRSLRLQHTSLIFNSDLTGTDHNIFYGLHSAITRQNKINEPKEGWLASQRMTSEEALRGFTVWPAFAAFTEKESGVLAVGKWADITVLNIDPLQVGEKESSHLLEGKVLLTIVNGKVLFKD